METLLFIDMLGVKARWHRGGRKEAEAAFNRFKLLINSSLRRHSFSLTVGGCVEADSVALICATKEGAVTLGRTMFLAAFHAAQSRTDERVWLRGVITPAPSNGPLRFEESMPSEFSHIRVYEYGGELLQAIAVEKSGFKGMRLLIDESLVTTHLRNQLRIACGGNPLFPFGRLNHSAYPGRIAEGYQDVLWMAVGDKDQWSAMSKAMASRLRWSSGEPEEFMQAAATQVVFHECSAIIASLLEKQN